MKKIILVFSFLSLSFSNIAKAQSHEIRLGVGDAIPYNILNILINTLPDLFTYSFLAGYEVQEIDNSNSFIPSFNLSYRFNITPRIKVGIDASGMFSTKKTTYKNKSYNDILEKENSLTVIQLFPSGEYVYFKKNKFELMGQVGLGLVLFNASSKDHSESNSETAFAFNIYPIGFRYGGPIGGFVQAGYGLEGIVKAGVSFKF